MIKCSSDKELDSLLKKSRKTSVSKSGSAYDLLGQWSKKDSELIEKAIEEGCEQIHPGIKLKT